MFLQQISCFFWDDTFNLLLDTGLTLDAHLGGSLGGLLFYSFFNGLLVARRALQAISCGWMSKGRDTFSQLKGVVIIVIAVVIRVTADIVIRIIFGEV